MNEELTDSTNEKEWRVLIKESIFETCVDTSTHAIPNILKQSSHIVLKITWIFCLMGCTGYCIKLIIESIQLYLLYPSITSTSIVEDIPTQFPAVSFCNIKLVNSSTKLGDSLTKLSTVKNDLNMPLYFWFYKQNSLLRTIINNGSYSEDSKKSAGFLIENMLVSCSFNALPCSTSDFAYFYNQQYGNCYKFNGLNQSSRSTSQIKNSTNEGSFYGLVLELYVGKPSTNTQNENHDGIILSIQNQTNEPFYQGSILTAAANAETYLNIKKIFRTKLEPPHGNCLNDFSFTPYYNQILNKLNRSYSEELCKKICTQDQFIKLCGCQHPNHIFDTSSSASVCYFDGNDTQRECFYNFQINLPYLDYCKSACPYECNSMEYEILSHTALYPTSFYTNILYNYSNTRGLNLSLSEIPQAFVKVYIYYDSLRYTKTVQSSQMEMSDLMANIGGNLGLFLGMSFLTFAEIIEISFNTVFIFIKYRLLNRKRKVINSEENQIKSSL
jgi:acid-sensing ion channel 5